MQYLSVQNISKRYGEKLLFENISFIINQGEKVALVASNGTGKSSLVRAFANIESPDSGTIQFANSIRTGILMQEPDIHAKSTILENVLNADNPATNAILKYESALNSSDEKALNSAMAEMDAHNAWDYETRTKQILYKLHLENFHRIAGSLSGGEQKRLALAKILVNEPDFLILDEPTNHLDLDIIEWLEEWLIQSSITLLLITHDRYFLERVCDRIIELENGEIYSYSGNYSDYLEKKQLRYENQAASVAKAKNLMRTELDWMRRMPKARGTKSKSRIDAFYELKKEATKKLETQEVELHINPERLGSKIAELHNVGMSYGDRVLFQKIDYKFKRFDKIGIIGPNGSGKSTFLKVLTEQISPTSGKVVIGDTVKFGIYSQEGMKFKEGMRVIEVVREFGDHIPLKGGARLSATQLLERFLFPSYMHYVYVDKLSGGEKRRLYLLTILIQNPNFLILDEPTNDLDLMTLNVLEEFLQEFPGCLVIVSHDRYFMDKLVDHVFVFKQDGTLRDFSGNYTLYRIHEEEFKKNDIAPISSEKESNTQDSSGEKLNYEERKLFNKLEREIEKLEQKKVAIHQEMADNVEDYEKLNKLNAQLAEITSQIEEKEMMWLELSERA